MYSRKSDRREDFVLYNSVKRHQTLYSISFRPIGVSSSFKQIKFYKNHTEIYIYNRKVTWHNINVSTYIIQLQYIV